MIVVEQLRWDDWNVAHIARHAVSWKEVEEVCHGYFLVLGWKKARIILIGPTVSGRLLTVILAPEGKGTYYTVTARTASKRERPFYETQNRR